MSKPKSKDELKTQSQANYEKLIALVNSYSKEEIEKEFLEGTLNRNVRDVLAHLHEWHLMMLNWYEAGMKGEKPVMPAKGFTWKTLPELNKKIQKKYADIELSKIQKLLNNSFAEVQKLIENHTNKELFEKKRYNWTGTTSLGAYLISNTSSHYNWAIKFIIKSVK